MNFRIFTLTGFLDLCGNGDYAYRFWMRDRFVRLHIFSAFSHYLWLCLDFEIRGSWRVFRRQTKCYQYIATHASGFRQSLIGSLSSDDSDGSENSKKKKKIVGLDWQNRQLCTCITLSYTSCEIMCLYFTFCRGLEHKTTVFLCFSWTLIQSFRIQLQRNLPTFEELNVME